MVGAGPAGLAAAVTAADRGVEVVLLDAGRAPGGQYWRQRGDVTHPPTAGAGGEPHAEHGSRRLRALWSRLAEHRAAGRVTLLSGTSVWQITRSPDGFVLWLTPSPGRPADGPARVAAERVVLCQGGADRQLPFPGWDLPGVMAAGGVQALLKASGTAAGRRAVVAGTGPFLLPVAVGLAEAGVEVLAVCEAGRPTDWARSLPAVLGVPSKAVEGAGLVAGMVRHRIPYRTRTVVRRALGEDALTAVELSPLDADGRPRDLVRRVEDVDLLAVGWGFTPSVELALQLGAASRVDVDGSLVVAVDEQQRTDVPGVWVAGEGTGVGGAVLSDLEGRLAGAAAAADAGASGGLPRRGGITRHRRFAAAMHRRHPVPAHWDEWLTEDTVVCRCEEVTAGRVLEAHRSLVVQDARSVKQVTRIGMGWCQGRVCGFAASCLTAALEGRRADEADLRGIGSRPLAAPVTLAELARLED
ncbi:FAD/NAD(P)-binding oxidoreductase [Desertihabitans brevis]|uniref:FAD/NAD(P)-binding oxidoreductase n=1 Tax=Desertihabitans brevis TaxID=2268447 RepID=A0A367YSR3_9ACTN|nr:FAD/NAD(P)-binding oxidoreductase [Desertihabitans brevis]